MPDPDDARPLRVLHVMNGATGGAALSTRDLIAELRQHRIESSVVCNELGTPEDYERLRDAVEGRILFTPLYWWNRKIRAHWWHRPWLELKQSLRTGRAHGSARIVADFAARMQVDLIHTNTLTTPEGGLAAKLTGLPHVWHARELVGPGTPYPLRLEGQALGRFLQEHAAYVVANSYVTAEQLRPWLPEQVLRVIPNGISTEPYALIAARPDPHPVVVGMAANFSRTKRHDLFIEAAARVDRNLDVEFRMYGHPPADPSELQALIHRHGLENRLHSIGFVADSVRIMGEVDIVLHPSDQESFGRVLVEAMAAGRPIVGVRGGGVGEIVVEGETGLLANPDSPEQLALHTERLVRDADLRQRLGEAGRRRAATHYDLKRCSEQVVQTYRNALESTQPAAVSNERRTN